MTIIIEIYIIVCILLLLFDICFLLVKNGRVKWLLPQHAAFEQKLLKEVEHYRRDGCFSQGFMDEVRGKLEKTKNLVLLYNTVGDQPELWELFREPVLALLERYQGKPEYEQAFYTYVISTFDYGKQEVPGAFSSRFIRFLNTRSLYTFTNTMMAVYAFGEVDLLLQSMDEIDKRSVFYHKKLLIDGLLSAQVDFDELNARLVDRFDRYTPYTQEALLDYFRMQGCDCAPLCLRLLTETQVDRQVKYSAMRYFAKFPSEQSRARFLEIMADGNAVWVEQMLAIQGLSRYDDPQVRTAIERKITSPSWFVRVNAVEYLHRQGLTREQVFDILYLRDRYANETLLYQFRKDKEMSRYIINTIQLLDQKAEMADMSDYAEEAAVAATGI